jgi:DNA-binding GntR family transcriptional regulator
MALIGKSAAPPPSGAQFIAGLLRESLVNGRLAPGTRIKEAEVTAELGMSRGPVREALRMLEEDGLVELLPNRGAVVSEYSALDLLEVYALRSHLGSLAIHKLIRSVPVGERRALVASVDEIDEAVAADDEVRAVEADIMFQDALVAASGLRFTSKSFSRLSMQVRMFVAVLGTRYDTLLHEIASEDRRLFDLVVDGDVVAADSLWRQKLERWLRDFTAKLPDPNFDPELWIDLAAGDFGAGRRP